MTAHMQSILVIRSKLFVIVKSSLCKSRNLKPNPYTLILIKARARHVDEKSRGGGYCAARYTGMCYREG